MRESNYYGLRCGAKVVEKRRGTVSYVQTGSVYWLSDEERAISGALLRFNPTGMRYTGDTAKEIARELHDLRIAHFRHDATGDNRADYDGAISRGKSHGPLDRAQGAARDSPTRERAETRLQAG